MEKRLPIGALGGQAVMEGVMMKGPKRYSIAVRTPDQKINVKLVRYKTAGEKHSLLKLPFIRGVVNFWESLTVGMRTLAYSSSFYEQKEEETKADRIFKDIFKEHADNVLNGLTVILSIIIAVALFMLLPAGIGEFLGKWIKSRVLLSVIEGLLRLTIFLVYIALISQMEDIKRVFMYHGAEHKTINCYESGDELTPENIARHSRYHKRCGTSFLFLVMIISIFVFMFITAENVWIRLLLRILLIPVVASLSYEFIRLAGKSDSAILNALSKPGMWVQMLTTKEPDEEMIEVAIISVEAVLYGKSYVDAVNEAQGIGVDKKKSSVSHTDVSEDQNDRIEYNEGYENEESGEEYEEVYEDEISGEEYEKVYEDEDSVKKTTEVHRNKDSGDKSEKTGRDDSGEEFDITDFEKSFFED